MKTPLLLLTITALALPACNRSGSSTSDTQRQADERRIAELRDLEQRDAQRQMDAKNAQLESDRQRLAADQAALDAERQKLEADRAAVQDDADRRAKWEAAERRL